MLSLGHQVPSLSPPPVLCKTRIGPFSILDLFQPPDFAELVSNAIVLPISGWLAGALGRKRFFMTCLAIFTASSLLYGLAPSLGFLLFFRVLHGAGGGGLQPMAQAILADTFPPQQRGQAFALYGTTAVTAPTIGPTLGGWITFNYSWRWVLFINLPVGNYMVSAGTSD